MKGLKKLLITLFALALAFVIAVSVFFQNTVWLIGGQKVIEKSESPDGNYTVTAYLINGGATTSYTVLCTAKRKYGFARIIYRQYRCDEAEVEWLDSTTVVINGTKLNIEKDTYDYKDSNL